MAISLQGFAPELAAIIEDSTLIREFNDALFPSLLFRMEAMPDSWPAAIGETTIFTRSGLMGVSTKPLMPGRDPLPSSYPVEQWKATAAQYGNTLDTHLPSSYVTLASKFLEDTKKLGMNAGQTLNRIVRDRLFNAYLGGDSVAIQAAGIGAQQILLASINGFSEVQADGQIAPVSALNPIPVTFTGTEPERQVVAAVPLDSADPLGPGIITLSEPMTVGVAAREGVKSEFRPEIIRAGGGNTVDSLAGAQNLTLQEVINAVAELRDQNVPAFEDGLYHVHLSPQAEAQLFADPAFQRLNQSLPDDHRYREFMIGDLVGARFFRNNEIPNDINVGDLADTSGGLGSARVSSELGAEVINQSGNKIRRTLVLGRGAVYEKFVPERTAYVSEAGVQGKIGQFSVTNNGAEVSTERIRMILRAPQDKLQQVVSQTWSWSGDFPVPTDGVTGKAATYKRALIIEHN